jgi:hypothetical protein
MSHPYRDLPKDPYEDDEFSELDDYDERLRALHEAQTVWERLAYLQTLKMPCPECGGAGQLYGGSLGSACPECLGARVVDHPASEGFELPDFAGMRALLSGAAEARDQRKGLMGEGLKLLKQPHPADMPSMDEIHALADEGRKLALSAPAAPSVQGGQLREPPRPEMHALDEGRVDGEDDGTYATDEYLDALEEGQD